MPKATAQITLIDIEDVGEIIVSDVEPSSPVDGSIWLNTSGEPPYRFYTYKGGQWVPTDYESLEELDPEQFAKLLETHTAIMNLDNDNKLTRYERSIVRSEIATITGKTLSPTDTMPTISQIDAGEVGELYALRQEAREAGVDTSSLVYARTATAYNDLRTYLSNLTPKAWDIESTEVTDVDSTWDEVWNEYKVAYNSLRVAVTVKQEQERKKIEEDVQEVTEEVSRIEQRVSEAEIKVQPGNIVSTVRESVDYQNDLDPKTIMSRINQDASSVTIDASKINLNGKITIGHFNPSLQDEIENKATKEEAQRYAEEAKNEAKEYVDKRKIGARNLIRNSNVSISTFDYNVAVFNLVEPLEEGQEYTITIKGTKDSSKEFGLWQNGGSDARGTLQPIGGDRYALTFKAIAPRPDGSEEENSQLSIYITPSSPTPTEPSTIEWAQLERGNVSSDWRAAEEDYQEQINDDIENLAEIVSFLSSELNLKAGMAEFEAMQEAFNARVQQDIEDKQKLAEDLASIEGRTALVEILANDSKLVTQFIETVITESEEGIFIGNETNKTGVLISDRRISFLDNDVEVAYISNQTMEITHGIFVESATISGFKFEKIPGTEILGITWVG